MKVAEAHRSIVEVCDVDQMKKLNTMIYFNFFCEIADRFIVKFRVTVQRASHALNFSYDEVANLSS